MAGIEDVAKLAGVSTATVSRALTGKSHVSEKARAKVEAAAAQLGYVASSSAYTLATGLNRNIGVVLPFIDRWFFSVALESVETTLIEHGYDVTLYNLSGGPEQRSRIFSEFLGRKRVDGVLTIAIQPSTAELAVMNQMKKPIVGIGGPIAGARTIAMDDVAAGRLATEHLISLGHTRIGNIGGTPGSEMEFSQPTLRRVGYLEALKDAQLEQRASWLAEADFTIQNAYFAAKQMLGDPRNAPTAIFCASDEMAFGAIMAAKDLGLQVPQDVSIVGIDNHDQSEFFGLSTISQNLRKQAVSATEMLLDVLAEPNLEDHVNIEAHTAWDVNLVVRSSTARPAPAHR